jgi:hypothetical protein
VGGTRNDLRAESLDLIEGRRSIGAVQAPSIGEAFALAIDVNGDVAAVVFGVREGHGDRKVTNDFCLRGGEWRLLGGSGGGPYGDLLADRPPRSRLGGVVRAPSASSHRLEPRLGAPWSSRFVRAADIRAAAEVTHVRIRGDRIDVPAHGHLVVVWRGRRRPRITAFDANGVTLVRVKVGSKEVGAGRDRLTSTLRRPALTPAPVILGDPSREIVRRRRRWSWWHPLGWVIETRYADGSSGTSWSSGRRPRDRPPFIDE